MNDLVIAVFVRFVPWARHIDNELVCILVGEIRSVAHPVFEVANSFSVVDHSFIKSRRVGEHLNVVLILHDDL